MMDVEPASPEPKQEEEDFGEISLMQALQSRSQSSSLPTTTTMSDEITQMQDRQPRHSVESLLGGGSILFQFGRRISARVGKSDLSTSPTPASPLQGTDLSTSGSEEANSPIATNTSTKQTQPVQSSKYTESEATEIIERHMRVRLANIRLRQFGKSSEFKRQKTRIELIKEVISTERTYVRLIKAFIEVYGAAVEENAKNFAPTTLLRRNNQNTKYRQLLFANIEQLAQINQTLLNALEKVSIDNCSISKPFISITPFMKHYVEYINAYDLAHKTYKNLMKSSEKFVQLMTNCAADPRVERNKFGSLLILPVQRIPRYRLLLTQILEHTDPDHIEYEDLKKALDRIIEVAGHINEQKRESSHLSAAAKVSRILQQVYDIDSFISPTRKLTQNPMTICLFNPDNVYNLYFFSDCMVLIESHLFKYFDKDTSNQQSREEKIHLIFYAFSRLFTYTGDSFILYALVKGKPMQYVFVSDVKVSGLREVYMVLESLISSGHDSMIIEKAEERCHSRQMMQNKIDENNSLETAQKATMSQLTTVSTLLVEKEEQIRKLQQEVKELLAQKQTLTEFIEYVEVKQQDVDNDVISIASEVKKYDHMFQDILKDDFAFKHVMNDTPDMA